MGKESEIAADPKIGLSFDVMRREAVVLITNGCIQKSIRNPRELSLRAGVDEGKTTLVFRTDGECSTPDELDRINGKEWDDLISAADVSLERWVRDSLSKSPEKIDERDRLTPLMPEYGASSNGQKPSIETHARIGVILGYSSAFYLRASGIDLPK